MSPQTMQGASAGDVPVKKSPSVSSISTGIGSPNHPTNHPFTPVHVQVARDSRTSMSGYLSPGASPFKGSSTSEPLSFGLSLSLSLEGQQDAPKQEQAVPPTSKKQYGQPKSPTKRRSAARASFGMGNGSERRSMAMYEPDEDDETWDPNVEQTPRQQNRRRWASITDGDASPTAWPAWSPQTRIHGTFRRSTLQQQGQQQQQQMQMQNQQLQMQQQLAAARNGNTSPPLSPTMASAPGAPAFAPSSPFGQSMFPGAQMQMVPGMQAQQMQAPMPNSMQPFHPQMAAMQGGMPYPYAALPPYAQMPYAAMPYAPQMGVTAPGMQAGGAFAPSLPVFPAAGAQQASMQHRQSLGGRSGKSRGQASSTPGSPVSRATSTQGGDSPTAKRGWTVIWVSDQAFKPAAAPQKTQLEQLGCQVKGYKTQKNAARALDKKRAIAKTVMLVSATEAASLMAYLQSRPELGTIPVVILANGRTAVNKYEGPHCAIADSFEVAMSKVMQVATDSGYH